jgi:hypothetical protein
MNHRKLRRVFISLILLSCILALVGPAQGSGYWLVYYCHDDCIDESGHYQACLGGGTYYATEQDWCVPNSDWDRCVSYCLAEACAYMNQCNPSPQCNANNQAALGWTCEW